MILHLVDRLLGLAKKIEGIGPLLARIAIASVFIPTGWGKLHDLEKITAYFTTLHIPVPHINAIIVANTEFFGGILVLIGLCARFASLPLAFSMIIAIITAKLPLDDTQTWVDFFAFDEFMYLALFVWVALAGPGVFSLDHFIWRALRKKSAMTPVPPTTAY
jgi:putative oxidoreductase